MIAAASPCPICGAAGRDRRPLDVDAVARGASVRLFSATCNACGWHYTPAPTREIHRIVCGIWRDAGDDELAEEIDDRVAAACYAFAAPWPPTDAEVIPCSP